MEAGENREWETQQHLPTAARSMATHHCCPLSPLLRLNRRRHTPPAASLLCTPLPCSLPHHCDEAVCTDLAIPPPLRSHSLRCNRRWRSFNARSSVARVHTRRR